MSVTETGNRHTVFTKRYWGRIKDKFCLFTINSDRVSKASSSFKSEVGVNRMRTTTVKLFT